MLKNYFLCILFCLLFLPFVAQRQINFIGDSSKYNNTSYKTYITNKIFQENEILDSLILTTPIDENLKNYYKKVYKAENYIIKGKYAKAAKSYNEAFRFIEFPFNADISQAIICELKSERNVENIKKYIWYKLKKDNNTTKQFVLNKAEFQFLPNWDDIKIMLDTTSSLNNKAIIDSLENLYLDDQTIRVYNSGFSDSVLVKMDDIDSINYYRLLKVLNKYPYISEESIGFKWEWLKIVPWHEPQRLEIYIKLFENVCNGFLDARTFFDLLSHSSYLFNNKLHYDNKLNINSLRIDKDEILIKFPIKHKNKKIINKYLEKLYYEEINKTEKKKVWQFKNNYFEVKTTTFYSNNYFMNYEFDFYKIIKTNKCNDNNCKIYYRSKADKKRIKKNMQEYYKTNSIRL